MRLPLNALLAWQFGLAFTGEAVEAPPPPSVDWSAQGKVTPVQDQGPCAAGYAFAAVAATESAWAIATGNLTKLSEQQQLDCSQPQGNDGCTSGRASYSFIHEVQNGTCTEASYPYAGQPGKCSQSSCQRSIPPAGGSAIAVAGLRYVQSYSETDIMQVIAQQPAVAAVDASSPQFQSYQGGIMNFSDCGTNPQHYVLIVGYGTDAGRSYWKAKNSWGTSWGENGYLRIVRGEGMCGIESDILYPVVSSPGPPGPSSPWHYEQPATTTPACRSDEVYGQVYPGYYVCAPPCSVSAPCTQDMPPSTPPITSAVCNFMTPGSTTQYCGMQCTAGFHQCPTGSECIGGINFTLASYMCMYRQDHPAPGAISLQVITGAAASPLMV